MKTLERWLLKVLRVAAKEDEDVVLRPLQCNRCSHEWWPRKLETPLACPGCRSKYWNKPRMRRQKRKGAA